MCFKCFFISFLNLWYNSNGFYSCGNPRGCDAVRDVTEEVAEDLARASLGQPLNEDHVVQLGEGADLLADNRLQLLSDHLAILVFLEDHEGKRDLALQSVIAADDCTLSNIRVLHNYFLNAACTDSMSSCVYHIISSRHNEDIPVLVYIASITCQVIAFRT